MRLFKNVGIESRLDASGIGVDVFIDAEDGWFFLPFPLFTGGGGGGRFSLLLLERNYFRRAESLFGVGMFNKESERIIIGAGLPHFSVSGSIHQRDFLERQYADGGFNATSGWRTTRDEDDPERFGSINEAHDKEFEGGTFSVSLRPVSQLKTSLSFEANEVSYASSPAASPGDAGNQNAVQVGVSFGPGDSNRANIAETFGVLFGLGLAGVKDAAPLSRTRWIWGGDISAAHGAKAVGSDFTFSQLSAALSGSAEFPSRHRLNGRLSLSQGIDLPFSRKIATGRDLGLKGNYAREFRGDTGAGTSIGYTRLLRRSARGILAAEAFVERGTVWQKDGPRFHQDGVGASFYYRFWRFPLPLGISYTQKRDFPKAEDWLSKAVSKNPTFCQSHTALGRMFADKKAHANAVKSFESALRHCPMFQEAHYRLGLSLFHLGQRKRALKVFEEFLQKFPESNFSDPTRRYIAILSSNQAG
jgi:hypothetical protein